MQCQRRLDETDDARPALEVPGIGLDRSNEARCVRGPSGAVYRRKRGQFNPVTDRCAGPVRLDEVDAGGFDLGGFTDQPEEFFLGRTVGRHDARRVAVMRDGATAYHGQYRVAVPPGVVETLERHHRGPFTATVAVGGHVEGFGPAVGCGGSGLISTRVKPGPMSALTPPASASDVSPVRSC